MLKSVFVSMFVFAMGCHADTTVQSTDGEGTSSVSPTDVTVNPQITDAVTQSVSPTSNVTCADGSTPVDGVCPQTATTTTTDVTVTPTVTTSH